MVCVLISRLEKTVAHEEHDDHHTTHTTMTPGQHKKLTRTYPYVPISTYPQISKSLEHHHLPLLTTKEPKEKLKGKIFSQVCTELNVTGFWRRAPFIGNILQVTLIDCDCNKYQQNLTTFWITAPFDSCGSIIEAHNHVIIQKNSATVKIINVTNNIISREYVYKYNMKCVFPRKKNVSMDHQGYNVTDGYTKTENHTSIAHFKVEISVYDSPTFMRKALTPVTVSTNQPIYIGIRKMNQNKNFKIVVQQCYATPRTKIHDKTSYIFFHNKCPLDSTFKLLNWNQNEFNFVIKTFRFIKISRLVYIHCRIYICKANSTSPLCDQTCSYRKRREISLSNFLQSSYIGGSLHYHDDIYANHSFYKTQNETKIYRRRRSLDVLSKSNALEEIRYVTSSRILYVKQYSCEDIRCPLHSSCYDLYPAVCVCNKGFILKFKTNTCENTRILQVTGLHLNKTWLESYKDVNSLEFRHLAYKTEVQLRRLFRALYLPDIEGVKITRAWNGSIMIDFEIIISESAEELTTYENFIKAILIGNKTGLPWFKEMDIMTDKLPIMGRITSKESLVDTIVVLIEIAIPSCCILFVILIILLYRQCKISSSKKEILQAKYAARNPNILKFNEASDNGFQNITFKADDKKVILPPENVGRDYKWDGVEVLI